MNTTGHGTRDYDVLAEVYNGGTTVECDGKATHNDYTVLNAYCRYYMGTDWYALQRPCKTGVFRDTAAKLTAPGQYYGLGSGKILQLPVDCYKLCVSPT